MFNDLADWIDEFSESEAEVETETPLREIAIIGVSAKLGMFEGLEEIWTGLSRGVDAIRKLPGQRKKDLLDYLRWKNGADEQRVFPEYAYMERIDSFDHEFFHMSQKEASLMDPHQRVFLQTVWHAIEDAGYGGDRLRSSRTGVFVGHTGGKLHYKEMAFESDPASIPIALPGNIPSVIASRISYLLDLHGPSLLIDTTCSSSLVALHMACQSIRNNECEMAIAGAVKIRMELLERIVDIGIRASDGRTKTFDDASDGTGSGEGSVALLLKPLVKALADGDPIYAVIKGSAMNQDGRSIGITAPNAQAQADVLVRAWQDAGVDPETITYIEAHGTGTKLGDPIEIEGMRQAFEQFTERKQFCAVGSIKSNIGHLDHGAGLAGVVKAILCLQHKQIPPTLHFRTPNREIDFMRSPVYVNAELADWTPSQGIRRCGVSSFGLSGTNCHVVLEEAPERIADDAPHEETLLLALSAKERDGLLQLAEEYVQLLEDENAKTSLADICYTANTGRGHYEYRLAIVFRSREELQTALQRWIDENEQGDTAAGTYLNAANESHPLHEIASRYVQGAEIDWTSLYAHTKHRRVHVPGYPFAKKRCWVRFATETAAPSPQKAADRQAEQAPPRQALSDPSQIPSVLSRIWGEVLGLDHVGEEDHFFDLGGNSLHAMALVHKIQQEFQYKASPDQVFARPTIREWVPVLQSAQRERLDSIPSAGKREVYPTTSAQKRLYFLQQYDPADTRYNLPYKMTWRGEVDPKRLQQAFQAIVQKHESFRTSFRVEDDDLVQKIHDHVELVWEHRECSEEQAAEYMRRFVRPFDLAQPPLLRVALLQVRTEKSYLLFDMHHIITDGTSMRLLKKELSDFYQGRTTFEPVIHYKDYAVWYDEKLKSTEMERHERFWLEQLAPPLQALQLPVDYPRQSVYQTRSERIYFTIPEEQVPRIGQQMSTYGVTLYMWSLSILNVLLWKHAAQEDICVGSPVAGRSHPDLQQVIGVFINTLVMRNRPTGNLPFSKFLADVKDNALNAFAHADYPFEQLVDRLQVNRDLSRNPLFDVMLILQNMPRSEWDFAGVELEQDADWQQAGTHDLVLTLVERDGELSYCLAYNAALYRKETAEKWRDDFLKIAESVLTDPDRALQDILIESDDETSRLDSEIASFNFNF